MYVVPAPKKVTIDGKLDDWDLSGQITMYVVSETSDMQSAKFAMMYDKDALYLSAVVRDPTPMMNRHDPQVDADRAWDADACQFRLTLDPKMGYPVNIGYGHGRYGQPEHRAPAALVLHRSAGTLPADAVEHELSRRRVRNGGNSAWCRMIVTRPSI